MTLDLSVYGELLLALLPELVLTGWSLVLLIFVALTALLVAVHRRLARRALRRRRTRLGTSGDGSAQAA